MGVTIKMLSLITGLFFIASCDETCQKYYTTYSTYSSLNYLKKETYTNEQYLKNYALSICIADGYSDEEVRNEGYDLAAAYMEVTDFPLVAYKEVRLLADKFLTLKYTTNRGKNVVLKKCVDLYNSMELEKIVHNHSKQLKLKD